MIKNIVLLMLVVLYLVSFVSCGGRDSLNSDKDKVLFNSNEKGENMDSKLLTVEELERYCKDNNIEYSNADLSEFISIFQLTADNIHEYNIKLLIAEDEPVESYNFLFENDHEPRKADFDKDISYIAFFINEDISIHSCLINVKEKYIVSERYNDVFDNVLNFEKKELSDEDVTDIINKIYSASVFEWESYVSVEEMDDPCFVRLVVLYEDDTSFGVSCSGIFSEFNLVNYEKFEDICFNYS